MTPATALCYWVEEPGRGALRRESLAAPLDNELCVRSEWSGISLGTERLVGLGQVPASCEHAMACRSMRGSFALPIAYGYSLVGVVDNGPRAGERVFTMHPHQDRVVIDAAHAITLPANVSSARATLLPNVETALNAVWDAELNGHESVAVIGAGAVGCLLAFVLARLHRGPITIVDNDGKHLQRSSQLPWITQAVDVATLARGSTNVAFHATGNGAGLQLALDSVGFEGRVVDLSWYGDKPITLRLGDSFHHERKRIVASQVGTVAPSHRAAGHAVRTRAVLELLGDARLDTLLGSPVTFADLPTAFAAIYRGARGADATQGERSGICPLVSYSERP